MNRVNRPRIAVVREVREIECQVYHVFIITNERLLADIDIESEDEDDDDEVVGGSTRPMTSRQAVLASVVDSSHVSLCR